MTFEISIGIFIFALLISRVLNEKALKELSEKKKVEIIDEFSNMRKYSILPVVIFIGGLYYFIDSTDINTNQIMYIYLLPLAYILVSQTYIYKKLLNLDFPKSYVRKFVLSQIVMIMGIGILFYDIF